MPAQTGNGQQPPDFLRRHLEKKWMAGLFMLACFAGAGLAGWHWFETPWAVRTAELGGLSSFSHLGGGLAAQLQAATADPWLPVLGIVLLAAGGLAGRVVAASHLARRLSVAAAVTLILLAAAHVAEELLLGAAVQTALIGHNLYAEVLALQGAAFLGYALLPVAGLVALLGGFTTFIRLSVWAVNRLQERFRPQRDVPAPAGSASHRTPGPKGAEAHWCDSADPPADRTPGGLGICLSGGGIRSATFGLGAIQALQLHPSLAGDGSSELSRARYLTAVSGGAYTAGALLLATHPRGDQPEPSRQPDPSLGLDQVFTPGSPEFDHLRRHSSYIADSFREWAIAILVVIRGAFLSMLFLGLVALTAGRWVGFLYYQIKRAGDLESPWQPVWGPVFATLAVAVLALLLWLVSTWAVMPHKLSRGLSEAARMTSVAVAILVVLGALIPIVAWTSMAIINATGGAGQGNGTPAGGAAKGACWR